MIHPICRCIKELEVIEKSDEVTNNNNNIPSEISQVGSGEGKMYEDLTLTSWR